MVRAGSFLGLRPMAEARVLNLSVGMASLCLEEEAEAVEGYFSSSSWARLARERLGRRESLEDFERDHHDLLWVGGGTNDIWRLGRGRKERWNYEGKWN